jgi:hypothetical protein
MKKRPKWWLDGGVFETATKQVQWFALKIDEKGSCAESIVDFV